MNKEQKVFVNFVKALFNSKVKYIEISLINKEHCKIATVIINSDLFKEKNNKKQKENKNGKNH